MPAKNVDQILIRGWQKTEVRPRIDQWSVDISVKWIDLQGLHHKRSGTYLFPNVLADVPLGVVRHFMEEIIVAKARVQLGIDTWEDYG